MDQRAAEHRKIVLIIDDDADCREGFSELLRRAGYFVLEADNGVTGIELLNNACQLPAMILLDMSMPVMDGPGFLKWRAKNIAIREVPVVVTSGSEPPAKPLDGVEGFLQKPVNIAPFLEIVNRCSDQQ